MSEVQTLEALERLLIEAPAETLEALLADDFVEFGVSGKRYDKHSALAAVQKRQESIVIADFTVRDLGCDTVLATYRTLHGDPEAPARIVQRSSVWRRKGRGWEVVFHQGMPIVLP